jgi:protoporphyrinogen oxidase
MDEKNLVIGAGASGLSFAIISTNETLLIERELEVGGHAKSTTLDKWVFDRGPHIIFSRDKLVLECIQKSLGNNILDCVRKNRVSISKKLVNYPIENGLHDLGFKLRISILLSFLKQKIIINKEVNNLEDWFIKFFGKKLTQIYFKPYNEKVWKVKLSELSLEWTDRIPFPKKSDFIFGLLFKKSSDGYLHQLYYNYPKYGGYQAIMEAWKSKLRPHTLNVGEEVLGINLNNNYPSVSTNKNNYDGYRVVSTMPLKKLSKIIDGVPKRIENLINQLVVNPMYVVTLGFKGIDKNNFTAIYFPEKEFLVNRVSFPHVFSKFTVPQDHFMIQAEITLKAEQFSLNLSEKEIIEHVKNGLTERGVIGSEPLVFSKVDLYEDAYVVYTKNHSDRIREIIDFFESRNLFLHGRFGAHEYLNVDGCLRMSIDLHKKIETQVLSDDAILAKFC